MQVAITALGILLSLLVGVSLSLESPCLRVVKKLTPQAPAFLFSVKAYAQYQKDIAGESTYTAPTHAGIRVDIPLYDAKERWNLKKEYLRALDFARRLLADYLRLRYEVEEMRRYVRWMWRRVDAGMEYRRDVWRDEIKLKQKEGELKALTALLMSAGIGERELEECYESSGKQELDRKEIPHQRDRR